MESAVILEQEKQSWSDEEVVSRVLAGDTPLYEILMRRYNQRLYRVARAILRDDAEAEDVMQDAYVRAYQHLAQFAGRARFSTWLTRIAMHEAWERAGRRARLQRFDSVEEGEGTAMKVFAASGRSPEQQAYDRELRDALEKAILDLPEDYRVIVMLRDVEEMSTEEAADCLSLSQQNVKVRLHRARAALREGLCSLLGATGAQSFQFHAVRCDRVVGNVFSTLKLEPVPGNNLSPGPPVSESMNRSFPQ